MFKFVIHDNRGGCTIFYENGEWKSEIERELF
jgi:hypothetical protein